MVRAHLRERYGDARTYRGGLRVYTTLDSRMQRAAGEGVDLALRAHDKRRGFRGFQENLVETGRHPAEWRHPSWDVRLEIGSLVHGVVTRAGPEPEIRIGRFTARVDPESLTWTRREAARLFRVGDVSPFRVLGNAGAAGEGGDAPSGPLRFDSPLLVALEQEPLADGAFLALEVGSGAIRAVVGGNDFSRSEFNRAVQARRQAGSSFKPFAYGAALASGRLSPISLLLDAPFTFHDPVTGVPYSPKNYDGEHRGWITMRRAFEGSRNIPAVRMVHDVGPAEVVRSGNPAGDREPAAAGALDHSGSE